MRCSQDVDAVFVPAKDLADFVKQPGMQPVVQYIKAISEAASTEDANTPWWFSERT